MSAVGDARKRLLDEINEAQNTAPTQPYAIGGYIPPARDHAFPMREIQTAAGRTALRDAAAYLEQFPGMAATRVWLLTYAGGYQAGDR